jgi:Protein of unknown function (DUF2752)
MSYTRRRWIANFAVLAAAFACYLLLRFPPYISSFYPRCPIFIWLHIYCPGCGGTRALAALLHGRLGDAMHWNALVVLLLPFTGVFFASSYWRAIQKKEFRWPTVSDASLKILFVGAGIFTLVRNLPAR